MLFLDDADYVKLRALAHGGTARRCSIELFLAKVFGREAEYEAQQDADAEAGGKKRRKQPKLDPSRHRWGGGQMQGRGPAAGEAWSAAWACWQAGCNACWLWRLLCCSHCGRQSLSTSGLLRRGAHQRDCLPHPPDG
jgi:hypothetical protein